MLNQPTVRAAGDEPGERISAPFLVVLYSDDLSRIGERRPLEASFSLGRTVDTLLGRPLDDDPQVSREHARFQIVPAEAGFPQVTVTDAGSTNGTWLNGEKITAAALLEGDILRIGNTWFQPVMATPVVRLDHWSQVLGASPEIDALRRSLQRVARHATVVCLSGETGVGKQVAAREIHRLSQRRGGFLAFDAESLGDAPNLDSLFAESAGGTVLLRRVDCLTPPAQLALMRWLDGQGTRALREDAADVRLVVSTRIDLSAAVHAGAFRDDLHSRVTAWPVAIEPLRDRLLDVGLLTGFFVQRHGRPGTVVSTELMGELLDHHWPRNVRDLEAVIEIACVEAGDEDHVLMATEQVRAKLQQLTRMVREDGSPPEGPGVAEDARPEPPQNRSELETILQRYEHNVSEVARYYRRHRPQIYRWMQRFGLPRGGP